MDFLTVLLNVALMFVYAAIGFILIKSKLLKSENIKTLTVVLMYICQPVLTFYSFQKINLSTENTVDMLLAFAIDVVMIAVVVGLLCLIFHKKFSEIKYRVMSISAVLGNVAFLGVPLIENLLPEYTKGPMLCSVFLSANMIFGWTIALFIITRDKKYLSLKKVLLNPAIIGLALSLILYCFSLHIQDIPYVGSYLNTGVTLIAKMSTPLCMMILGARLATTPWQHLFLSPLNYLTIGIKLVVIPLLAFAILKLLPLNADFVSSMVIICAAPCAQITQSFTELVNQGQEEAASSVLLSTMLSILSLPLICLLLG